MAEAHDHWKKLADILGAQIPEPLGDQPAAESPELPKESVSPPMRAEKPRTPARAASPPRENHWRLLSNELGVAATDPAPVVSPPPPANSNRPVVPHDTKQSWEERGDEPDTEHGTDDVDPLLVDQQRFVEEIGDVFAGSQISDDVTAGPEDSDAEQFISDEDSSGGEAPSRRRRRRRGGRRRRRDEEGEPTAPPAHGEEEISDEDFSTSDEEPMEAESLAPKPAEEEIETEGGRRRPRRRRGRRTGGREKELVSKRAESDEIESEEDDDLDHRDDDDDDDDGSSSGRPRHKKIPSWTEAIEVIVTANLANRERGGGNRRGRR